MFISIFVILSCLFGSTSQEPDTKVIDAIGTIVKVGELGYGIDPESDPGTRYAPDELGEVFHHDGMRVRFSGEIREISSNDRLKRRWGIPFRLTKIEPLAD